MSVNLDAKSLRHLKSLLVASGSRLSNWVTGANPTAMQFNVSGLLKEPTGATRRQEIDGAIKAPVDTFSVDSIWDRSSGISITGSLSMVRTDVGIWMRAQVKCTVVCRCGRCLAPHAQSMELSIDEEFFPNGHRAILDEADETQFISPDNVLDLNPTMQQYVALAIPMSPICTARCAGMCQGCGANLNSSECLCAAHSVDPRWAALASLDPQPGGAGN